MADETTGATAPSAPIPQAESAAPAASPPPVENTPSAQAAEAPPVVADPVPVSDPEASSTPPADEKPAEAKASESLLGADAEKKEDPAAEKPAEGEAQETDEGGQSGEPAPLPSFEAFTLPEGLQGDADALGDFTKDLAEFEQMTKADHAALQSLGQKMVDRHIAAVQETVDRLNTAYVEAFQKQQADWKTSFEKDPEIGGNRADTTVNAALQFIRAHGGTETQQKEFRELMNTTGIGNHPAMIRLLAKANSALAEGKPLPAEKPPQQPKSKVERRYGQMNTN